MLPYIFTKLTVPPYGLRISFNFSKLLSVFSIEKASGILILVTLFWEVNAKWISKSPSDSSKIFFIDSSILLSKCGSVDSLIVISRNEFLLVSFGLFPFDSIVCGIVPLVSFGVFLLNFVSVAFVV